MSIFSKLLGERAPSKERYGGKPLGAEAYSLGDQNPADGIGIGLTGPGPAATRGAGVLTYIDEDGNPQAIPVTESSFIPPPQWDADFPEEGAMLGTGLAEEPYVVDPMINPRGEDELLHDQIHAPVPQLVRVPHNVNPDNPGVPNIGPVHEQPAFTARTQIVPHIQSEEQGWGMEGRIVEERFPIVTDPNPFWNQGIFRRNGMLDFSSEGIPFGRFTSARTQAIEEMRRNRSSVHERLVDNPAAQWFSETVPVEGQAGPIPEPIDVHDYAIY